MKKGYLIAAGLYGVYWLVSTAVFAWAVARLSWETAMAVNGGVTVVWALIFLEIFDHDKDWQWVKKWEIMEAQKEKKLIRRLMHWGKLGTTAGISFVAGPMFGAVAAVWLLPKNPVKVWAVVVGSMASSWMALVVAKGGWQWIRSF